MTETTVRVAEGPALVLAGYEGEPLRSLESYREVGGSGALAGVARNAASTPPGPAVVFDADSSLVASADGAGWVVTPPALLPSAVGARIVRGDPSRQPLALGDFEARVRALAGGGR